MYEGECMKLSGITYESVVDGPGLRFVIYTQGCPHHCPECHNPETWDTEGGKEFSVKQVLRMMKQRKKIRGVTFSGGEPFLYAAELAELALAAKGLGLDVTAYTGFTYEQLAAKDDANIHALLNAGDILVDGRYIHEMRGIGLKFRGSANQRVIDLEQSRKAGRAVLWEVN